MTHVTAYNTKVDKIMDVLLTFPGQLVLPLFIFQNLYPPYQLPKVISNIQSVDSYPFPTHRTPVILINLANLS